jgi:hypothetical protein
MIRFRVGQRWTSPDLERFAEVVVVSDDAWTATVVVTSPQGQPLDRAKVNAAAFQELWQLVADTPRLGGAGVRLRKPSA